MSYLGTELAGSHCPRRYYAARAPPLPILWHHFFKACYKRIERERRGEESRNQEAVFVFVRRHHHTGRLVCPLARRPARPPSLSPSLLFAAAVVWVVTVVAALPTTAAAAAGNSQPSTNPLVTAPLQPGRKEGERDDHAYLPRETVVGG